MKPSPEQVREWAEKAGAKFDPHWGIAYNTGTATFERFAELAAQWGAAQAQQTTEETDAEMALRSIASWLGVGGFNAPTVDAKVFEQKIYEGVEMAIKSHYATVEEPELPEAAETLQIPDTAFGRDCGSITKLIFHLSMAKWEPRWLVTACWLASLILERIKALGPLYTATQMHNHYAAGVRAGMATVKESLTTGKQRLQVPTGWAAPKDQYAVPVLFNPYTGEPRDVRDVQSDPQGILIVPPGKVNQLAAMQGGQK